MTDNEKKIIEDYPAEEIPVQENTAGGEGNTYTYTPTEENTVVKEVKPLEPENTVAGAVGAFLFSLVGAAIYFVIYQFGYIAGICGLVTVVLAIKGYSLFGKRETLKGVIIATVISVLALSLAYFASLSYTAYSSFKEVYLEEGLEFPYKITDSVSILLYIIETDTSIIINIVKDYVIMLALCGIGAFSSIRNAVINAKANKEN